MYIYIVICGRVSCRTYGKLDWK